MVRAPVPNKTTCTKLVFLLVKMDSKHKKSPKNRIGKAMFSLTITVAPTSIPDKNMEKLEFFESKR